ncbi:hypothetical protein CC1G_08577 [Coprinopsis cinerea okayama7|uniref:Uncharacterized protein n=1 Tax=Coprinopsis cinerea (strain Okayama-7 / 130 / ATCC MYA-4618 / FGSC 9003) TaxID=240176 RepID=A8NCU2_COPC7|nr:hypothetical protein CC1G_08577 [Coprinopsis cinerea okayama7\|eukprot:XP_001832627.2 hypothetical protein CC1G_08577 [Coprinopsis cinerea okayama7\
MAPQYSDDDTLRLDTISLTRRLPKLKEVGVCVGNPAYLGGDEPDETDDLHYFVT